MAVERKVRTFTVEIDREAAEVFAYLADITRHGEWSDRALRIEPLAPGGPVAVGAKYRSFGFTGPKPFETWSKLPSSSRTSGLDSQRRPRALTPFATPLCLLRSRGVRVDRIIDAQKSHGKAALLEAVFVTPTHSKTMKLLKSRLESAGKGARAPR